ncbi:MAG: hypothetical protein WCH98_00855 [Verrucomicrobiota bacterium]
MNIKPQNPFSPPLRLAGSVESHLIGFAAEVARQTGSVQQFARD